MEKRVVISNKYTFGFYFNHKNSVNKHKVELKAPSDAKNPIYKED